MNLGEFRKLTEGLTDEAEINVYQNEEYDDGDGRIDVIVGAVSAKASLSVFEGSVYVFISRENEYEA